MATKSQAESKWFGRFCTVWGIIGACTYLATDVFSRWFSGVKALECVIFILALLVAAGVPIFMRWAGKQREWFSMLLVVMLCGGVVVNALTALELIAVPVSLVWTWKWGMLALTMSGPFWNPSISRTRQMIQAFGWGLLVLGMFFFDYSWVRNLGMVILFFSQKSADADELPENNDMRSA